MNFPGQKFTLVEGRKASFGKMLQEVKLNERVKHGSAGGRFSTVISWQNMCRSAEQACAAALESVNVSAGDAKAALGGVIISREYAYRRLLGIDMAGQIVNQRGTHVEAKRGMAGCIIFDTGA